MIADPRAYFRDKKNIISFVFKVGAVEHVASAIVLNVWIIICILFVRIPQSASNNSTRQTLHIKFKVTLMDSQLTFAFHFPSWNHIIFIVNITMSFATR